MKKNGTMHLSKNVLIALCCGVAVTVASLAVVASRLLSRRNKRKAEEALLDEQQEAMAEGDWEESAQ